MVQFDRTMELWYDSPSAWKNAVIDNPPAYHKARVVRRSLVPKHGRHLSLPQAGRRLREHVPARATRGRVLRDVRPLRPVTQDRTNTDKNGQRDDTT